LIVKLEYIMANALHADGENSRRLTGRLPISWEYYWLNEDYIPNRETPFEVLIPVNIDVKTQLHLPDQVEFLQPEKLKRQGQTKFLLWSTKANSGPQGVVVNTNLDRGHGAYGAQEYEAFYHTSQEAMQALQQTVAFGLIAGQEQADN
jgi:hypothetical protein